MLAFGTGPHDSPRFARLGPMFVGDYTTAIAACEVGKSNSMSLRISLAVHRTPAPGMITPARIYLQGL
jgi:hypothetical protein